MVNSFHTVLQNILKVPNGFVAKAQPRTAKPDYLVIFLIKKIFLNMTTLYKILYTEQQTIKPQNCQERNRCRLEPRVRCCLFKYYIYQNILPVPPPNFGPFIIPYIIAASTTPPIATAVQTFPPSSI